MVSYADRLNTIEPFRVVEVLTRAKELAAQGRDIVHMEVGEPDFGLADRIRQAARQALDEERIAYTPAAGVPELREAISRWYRSNFNVDIAPQRIMITPGASGALLLLSALFVQPGRGVLMADPGYPCNRNFLRLFGGEEQLVPVGPGDNFQITAASAERHWSDNTIGVLAATPSNPTGTVIPPAELAALQQLCRSRGGILLVDEIYQQLVYDQHPSTVLSLTDDVYVINSFSKFFGMTGWRLGWLVAPEKDVAAMEVLAQNLFISMSTPAQYAALAGFEPDCQAVLEERIQEFARRRNYLLVALRELGFTIEREPEGAFYIYANIRAITDLPSQQFCMQLLEEQGIAITPGTDFGICGADDHVRFSYTTSMDRLRVGVERLRRYLM